MGDQRVGCGGRARTPLLSHQAVQFLIGAPSLRSHCSRFQKIKGMKQAPAMPHITRGDLLVDGRPEATGGGGVVGAAPVAVRHRTRYASTQMVHMLNAHSAIRIGRVAEG